MKNVSLTRGEAALFVVTLTVPLLIEAALAVTAFPELRWLLPTSMLFPAGLLAGIAMRGKAAAARVTYEGEGGPSLASGAS